MVGPLSNITVQVLDKEIGYEIPIQTLTGRRLILNVDPYMTVEELKEQIEEREGTPKQQQRIILRGKQIENDFDMEHYGITESDVLHLVLRLRGGANAPEPTGLIHDPFNMDKYSIKPKSENLELAMSPELLDIHVRLISLSQISGEWNDIDEVWKCIQNYHPKLVKNDLLKLRQNMTMEAFLTILVLIVLNKFATEVRVEWEIKERQSRKYLKKCGIQDEQIANIADKIKEIIL